MQDLSHKQTIALAGEVYREMIAAHESNPGAAADWRKKLEADASAIRNQSLRRGGLFGRFAEASMTFLDRKGIQITPEGLAKFIHAVAEAVVQGDEHLLRNAEGDYSPDPKADRFPKFDLSEKEKAAGQSLVALYDIYAKQVQHTPGTIKRWRPKIRQFEEFVAPTPWHLATRKEVIAWHDALLEEKLKPITLRDVHFAANKALYSWLEEREWCANPFKGVRVRMPKYEEEVRDKELSEGESRVSCAPPSNPSPSGSARNTATRFTGYRGSAPTLARG